MTNAPVRSNVRPAVSLRHYGASSSRADGQESAGASRSAPSTAALSLRDMSAEAAVKYIRDLYAGGPSELAVNVAEQPSGNSVSLLGPPAAVRKAV